jgi:polysaccharide export outer membrane protein
VRILGYLISFFILFSGCSSKKHELFYKNSQVVNYNIPSGTHAVYKIKPGDRLSIIFFQYPELSTKSKDLSESDVGLEVRLDGSIIMPLIGKVFVKGMTKEAVTDMLYKRYSSYLEKPALRVEVLNQRVYVLGEVKNPGAIDMMKYRKITPIQAVTLRGGLTDFAQREVIKVVRGTRDNYYVIHIDLTDLQSIKASNFNLLPDDIVYVAHNRVKDFNLPLSGANPSLSWINTLFSTLTLYQAFK